eukprot:FR736886.1.p3 GENE.FR736886.1~~FR736886.1.p3  ORF type:complete len:127 (-),score=51.65 FR736886.1:851-1231(-)
MEKKNEPRQTAGRPFFFGGIPGALFCGGPFFVTNVFFFSGYTPQIFSGNKPLFPPLCGGKGIPVSPHSEKAAGPTGFQRRGGSGKKAPKIAKQPFPPGGGPDFKKNKWPRPGFPDWERRPRRRNPK